MDRQGTDGCSTTLEVAGPETEAVALFGPGRPLGEPAACLTWDLPQIHAYSQVLVGVFSSCVRAQLTLAALRQAGFVSEQLGLAARSSALGPVNGLLAAAGRDSEPFDALVDLGIPGDAARIYQREFDTCRGIVAVAAADRAREAIALLEGTSPSSAGATILDDAPVPRHAADRSPPRRARSTDPSRRTRALAS